MFSGGQRAIAPTYMVKEEKLTLRPYNAALGTLTQTVCAQIEGNSVSDRCLFEARTAFDCVLRHKVRQYGATTDNIGACTHQINNMKQARGEASASIIDQQCEKLHYARKSFV